MLRPGEVPESLFWWLIELSPLRSERIVCALRDFLVIGHSRQDVCERYKVSYSYFSVVLKRIIYIDRVVCELITHYVSAQDNKES
ncbi:transcriptional regulator [Salmonella enterica]|uniref:PapB/FocB family fimbrial expression transcriptional regulator n=1 Tax=Escherichia coli TaxID=562 RepID=UPI00127F1D82|nr:transcriptional regulator [Salmonella enterica]EDR3611387.1 transcriptional regulator [Salmonella enterica subsp. enterica serovar Weltevreden]EFN6235647.1 transcriptional regulator [Escherichia coli]EBA5861313.1 transcriptional regulator [Salmonella enterica]EBN0784239.1 transcriptional regulator [Salmonella enterica]